MTTLLLDVMGTLVYDPFFEVMPRHFGLTLRELIDQKHPTAWVEFELGQLSEAELLAKFFADGRDYDHAAFKGAVREAYALLPGVEPVLQELQSRQTPMYALSNYSPWYEMIEDRTQLSRFLDWSFVSCRTGVRKPDPEAYLGPARQLGVDPADCLFVDDRETNVTAARDVGMDAVLFEDAAGLRAALTERSLLP